MGLARRVSWVVGGLPPTAAVGGLRRMVASTPTWTSVAVAPTPSGSGPRPPAGPLPLVLPPPAAPPVDAPPAAPPLRDAPPVVVPGPAAAASVAPVVSPGATDASVLPAFSPALAFDDAFLPVLLVDPHAASKPSSTSTQIDRRSDRRALMRTGTPSPGHPRARHTNPATRRRRARCRRGPLSPTPRN